MKTLLITNNDALNLKYHDRIKDILNCINSFIESDKAKDIETIFIDISNIAIANISSVKNPMSYEENKKAIDAIYNHYKPDYMVLFGAQDIIPFQQMIDPVDSKKIFYSDLPYACDASYSDKINSFTNPTRNVTRIPDVYGKSYADDFIRTMSNYKSITSQDISNYNVWWNVCTQKRFTEITNVQKYFDNYIKEFVTAECPPHDSEWEISQYNNMVHYHILHGATNNNCLYGEDKDSKNFPIAIDSSKEMRNIKQGNILLECACYGAQLYSSTQEKLPLSNIYTSSGSIVFASTDVTFSKKNGDIGYMDILLCEFMDKLFEGNDIATALLLARRKLTEQGKMDTVLLKTLGEFVVYGYPTNCPISSNQCITKNTEQHSKQWLYTYMESIENYKDIENYILSYLTNNVSGFNEYECSKISCFKAMNLLENEQDEKLYYSITLKKADRFNVYVFSQENKNILLVDEYESN